MATVLNDLTSKARIWQALGPVALSEPDFFSDSVDLIEGDGPAFAILSVRPSTGSPVINGTIETSADAETWTELEGTSFTIPAGQRVLSLTFRRPDRFARLHLEVTNADDPVNFSAVLGQARKLF